MAVKNKAEFLSQMELKAVTYLKEKTLLNKSKFKKKNKKLE